MILHVHPFPPVYAPVPCEIHLNFQLLIHAKTSSTVVHSAFLIFCGCQCWDFRWCLFSLLSTPMLTMI